MSRIKADVRTTCHFDVRSTDGTSLAVWVDGDGPPLVLVHGSLADHTTFESLVGQLRDGVTTYSMDRRGFGASGDASAYAIEREFEDVAAVCDAVAARSGDRVVLWGYSYGAGCAIGGAALTSNVRQLVLHEPGLGITYQPGQIETIEAALAAGDNEGAILAVLVEILGMTKEEIDTLRSGPRWANLLAGAPLVAREARVEDGWEYRPGLFDAITVPTLFLAGSESPPVMEEATSLAAAAIPGAEIRVLAGHSHLAHKADPALVAGILREIVLG